MKNRYAWSVVVAQMIALACEEASECASLRFLSEGDGRPIFSQLSTRLLGRCSGLRRAVQEGFSAKAQWTLCRCQLYIVL